MLVDSSSLLTEHLLSKVDSGSRETYRGSFLFLLVENRSFIGKSQILRILWTMEGWRYHSDGRIWFYLDRESACS